MEESRSSAMSLQEQGKFRATPGMLVTLVEIHAEPGGPSNDYRAAGLALNNSDSPSGWVLTGRGLAWLEMLLATPLPVSRWVDPRLVRSADEPVGSITSAVSE